MYEKEKKKTIKLFSAGFLCTSLLVSAAFRSPQLVQRDEQYNVVAKAGGEDRAAYALENDTGAEPSAAGYRVTVNEKTVCLETKEEVVAFLERIKEENAQWKEVSLTLLEDEEGYYQVEPSVAAIASGGSEALDVSFWESVFVEELLLEEDQAQELEEAVGAVMDGVDFNQENLDLYDGLIEYLAPLEDMVISSTFGERWGRMHKGLDFACEEGTPVHAAKAGTVEVAQWLEGYGNCIYLNHEDGTQTRYAHLSEILVNAGDEIAQSGQIALSGNTGNSTGPHLHFEILEDGIQVDPYPYILE